MRLTLRTLLAYMDDVLDPADHSALGDKIESSEFAADLIHKTRDTMRRLRLGAPELSGRGMGLDPNTVAEYLDNTLPPENVADFERVCLESEVHLAEAASCHQILTMVLGEPAEVDSDTRQRLYQLSDGGGDQQAEHRVDVVHTAAIAPSTVQPSRQVPEYLREPASHSNLKWWIAGAAAALVGVAYLALGPEGFLVDEPEMPREIAAMPNQADIVAPEIEMGGVTPLPENSDEPAAETDISPQDMSGSPDPDSLPPPFTANLEPNAQAELTDAGPSLIVPTRPEDESAETSADPDSATPDAALTTDVVPNPFRVASDETPGAAGDERPLPLSDADLPLASIPSGGEAPIEIGDAPPPGTPPANDPRVSIVDPAQITAEPSSSDPGSAATAANESPLGALVSRDDVFLRHLADKDAWIRVAPQGEMERGIRYLALPTYRPSIHFVAHAVTTELSGGTLIRAGRNEELAAGLAIELIYGRVVIKNVGPAGNLVVLTIGDQRNTYQLGTAAVLAVEVAREYVRGRDPEIAPGPLRAEFYVTSGNVVRQDDELVQVDAPSLWTMDDTAVTPSQPLEDRPDWIDQEPMTSTERRASRIVAEGVALERPADISLLELVEHRQIETRSLATRCSAHVGRFGPFIDALGDVMQRPHWKKHIVMLRKSMAESPETATSIHRKLLEQRGNEADGLFEMLRGYSDDQVGRTRETRKNGALRQLIDWLDHERLDYRVLAIHNLRELTGKNLGSYSPRHDRAKRQRAQKIWYERLNNDALIASR